MRPFRSVLTISITLLFVMAGCEDDNGDTGPGTNEIWMQNTQFMPDDKTVEKGATITWINKDSYAHAITTPNGLFDSGNIEGGETYEYTFDSLGTYQIQCTIHPDMTGIVTVATNADDTSNDDNTGDDTNDGGGGY